MVADTSGHRSRGDRGDRKRVWKLSPKAVAAPTHTPRPDLGVSLPVAPALPAGDGKVALQDPDPGMGEKGAPRALSCLGPPIPGEEVERISGHRSVGFQGSWIYPAALGHGGGMGFEGSDKGEDWGFGGSDGVRMGNH